MSTYKLKSGGRGGRGGRNKRTLKKIKKGGLFGFSNKEQHIDKPIGNDDVDVFTCPNVNIKCPILDKDITKSPKYNSVWNSCIYAWMGFGNQHITYITQSNILIKNVETIQIPTFNVSINGKIQSYPIKIENKYVNSFIKICGRWYAMMRLFGHTLFTKYIVRNEASKTFYILDERITFNEMNGLITMDSSYINVEIKRKVLQGLTPTETIILKETMYENINKKNGPLVDKKTGKRQAFWILNEFRLQKMLGNDVKYEIAEEGLESIL